MRTFGLAFLLFISFDATAQPNYLQLCWDKQVKPLQTGYLSFSYHENLNELYHSSEPWQQINYSGKGMIWCNATDFLQQDTLANGKRMYYSKTVYTKNELLFLDYGSKEQLPITKEEYQEQLLKTVRYSPMHALDYFFRHNIKPDREKSDGFAVYHTMINKNVVKLFINKSNNLVDKVTTLSADELHGDVLSTFTFSDYATTGKLIFPKTISIQKMNGKVMDEVKLLQVNIVKEVPKLLEKPVGYKIKEAGKTVLEIKTEKYSEHIHFIDLIHANTKVMVVEFSDFLFFAEAPLNDKNGELIISEAKKIAPDKPVKYFAFGHHHPHYLGGMRPFIHKGATVLCVKEDEDYVRYLAGARHTLSPDSLQLEPRTLDIKEVKDSLTITDGAYAMKIYFIGEKSGHTKDYLVYYFPEEKLVFEDDLLWIEKKEALKKANAMEHGFYGAIKETRADVKTIIQSWGITSEEYKMVIPFEDLEKAVNLK